MQINKLASKVRDYAKSSGLSDELITTGLADLNVFSKDENTTFEAVLYQPVFCLILQGRKETVIGDRKITYGKGDALVVSHDLPVVSRVTKASPHEPYLALVFHLDLGILRSLDDQIQSGEHQASQATSIALHVAESPLIDALERYFDLRDNPIDSEVVAPLVRREIHFRLLRAPYGAMLRKMLNRDSHASRIDQAIGLIRQQYKSNVSVPELAQSVGMSASSFHDHFKSVTQTTPLRYQKDLRLMEAKRLLSEGAHSVSSVAYEVGYESPNQFSREYARKFGIPPRKDAMKPIVAA